MKTISLTQNQVAVVDDQDFEFLSQWRWCANKYKSGFRATRNRTQVDPPGPATIYMHRVVAERAGMQIKGLQIDHKNDEGQIGGLDNRRCNLRPATNKQNMENRKSWGKSGIKGVGWHKQTKKWRAQITHNRTVINLGYFDDIELAKQARLSAEQKYFTHGSKT